MGAITSVSVDFQLTAAELAFKDEVRTWLEEHMVGEFAKLRGRGGMGQEDIPVETLLAWERELAKGGWLGIDYPKSIGGRECSLSEQVIFFMTWFMRLEMMARWASTALPISSRCMSSWSMARSTWS